MSNNSSNPLYYIYLNLHSSNPKTFSLMQNGLVTKNLASFKAERAKFLVRKGGHSTAVKEQTRNVHAFVVCEPKHVNIHCEATLRFLKNAPQRFFPVHYHYNDGDFFSIKFGDESIPLDEDYEFKGVLLHDHKCYLLKHVAYEYLLKRKVTAKHFLDTVHTGFSEAFIKSINLLMNAHAENKLNEIEGFKYATGICENLYTPIKNNLPNQLSISSQLSLESEINNFLGYAFSKWKNFSGCEYFPISPPTQSDTNYDSQSYYGNQENKWVSNYGLERVELLKHVEFVIKNL